MKHAQSTAILVAIILFCIHALRSTDFSTKDVVLSILLVGFFICRAIEKQKS